MAGYIKGITIEFGADTSKLNTALGKFQGKLNKTQAELRQINTALKFNPRNATLLSQKFDLLQKNVQQTDAKLKGLQSLQRRMDKNNVDKNSAQYRQLQREIIKTEDQLKQAKAELKKFGTVGQQQVVALGNKMKALGAKAAGVGRSLTTHLSMPLTIVGGMAGTVAAEFDEGMSKVQAISGATGEDFEALRNKAREMGAETKFSATESAEALSYMAMAGWKTEDMLSGIEGVMNLAAASGEDLATTSDIVTDALTAFGLQAADSGHFADVLAVASSNANTNVGMMGETFKYAAPIAGAFGYSIEDTAEAIGLMANAGIKSSQAGTSLRKIMTELSHDFTISGEKIGDVTIATTNADGSMRSLNDILADSREAFSGLSAAEKTAAAESLVGKNAMSGFLALMNASPKDISKLETALGNADGAAEEMAETMMNNFGGQLTILKSQLSEAGIAIGETLTPFLSKLTDIVQVLVDKFNSLSPVAQRIIVIIGIIAAAIGPLITIVGVLMGAIGSILTFAPMIATAATAVGGAFSFLLGPIGLVIAGIAAAIAIGVVLYKNWDKVKALAVTLKNSLVKTWNSIKAAITKAVQAIVTWVTTKFNTLKATVTTIFNGVKRAIVHPIQTARDLIKKIVDKIKSFFKFKISIPHIKLPHFTIRPAGWKMSDLLKGKIPSLGIKWYAQGGIFDSPTIAGIGEAGPEAVVPLNKLWDKLDNIASASSGSAIVVNVYGSDNMSVDQLATAVEQKLIQMQRRRTAAWA